MASDFNGDVFFADSYTDWVKYDECFSSAGGGDDGFTSSAIAT